MTFLPYLGELVTNATFNCLVLGATCSVDTSITALGAFKPAAVPPVHMSARVDTIVERLLILRSMLFLGVCGACRLNRGRGREVYASAGR